MSDKLQMLAEAQFRWPEKQAKFEAESDDRGAICCDEESFLRAGNTAKRYLFDGYDLE